MDLAWRLHSMFSSHWHRKNHSFFYLALRYLVVFTWHCVWLSPKDDPDKERKQRKKKKSKNGKKSYTAVPSVEFDFLSLPLSSFPQTSIFEPVLTLNIDNKAEIDVFLELSCFFHDPADVGNLISGSSAFSKTSLSIRKFMVHILLKPGLENFEHYLASMWDKCNCVVIWIFFDIAFLWDWNENWHFPVLWPLLSFPNLLARSESVV